MKLPLAAWVELGQRRRTLHLLVDMVRVVEMDMENVVDMEDVVDMARVVEVDMENVVDMADVVLTNTRILFMIGSNKAGTCKGRTLTENINLPGSPGQVLCIRI